MVTRKMAFSVTGFLSRILRPSYSVLGVCSPLLDLQARHYAARKGTREKALKKKLAFKRKRAAQMAAAEALKKKTKATGPQLEPTIEPNKPKPPIEESIYCANKFTFKEYTLPEALKCCREYFHPTIFNAPNSIIHLCIELNLGAKSKKGTDKWKGVIIFPHEFSTGVPNRIMVFCDENLVPEMMELGADIAGDIKLITRIKEENFDMNRIDRVIGDVKFSEDIIMIRPKLKLLTPRAANGTLTTDVTTALRRFKSGIEYICHRSLTLREFGWINIDIATLNMKDEEIERNFECILRDLFQRKLRDQSAKNLETFVRWIWLSCPNMAERFRIDAKPYVDRIIEEVTKSEEEEGDELQKVSESEPEEKRVAARE